MKFQDDISMPHTYIHIYIHTYVRTSRNQYASHFFKVGAYFKKRVHYIKTNEPRREKTGFLHLRKQRRRSASR